LQAGVSDAPPYFASTHAARLRARLRSGPADHAVDDMLAAVDGIGPVRFSFPYLDLPFRESVILLRHVGRPAEADAVKATGLAIYPESLPLRLA
jgi:hypothetical protein